jgi:hypothetical protein
MTIDPNRPAFGPANIEAAPPPVPSEGDRMQGPRAVRRIQIRGRAGIWEVTRDDRFYGHYMGFQAAFDAAEAAALAIVASGGAADIRFKEGRLQPGVPEPARGSGLTSISAMRTMQFRAGSAPIGR